MDKQTVVRLFNLLSDNDRNLVLKDVAQNGFSVPGFKDLTKVPLPILIKAMGGRKNRRTSKYPYQLVLEAIARLQPDDDTDIYSKEFENLTPSIVAKLCLKNSIVWLEKVNSYLEMAEKEVNSIEESNAEISATDDKNEKNNSYLQQLEDAKKQIHDLNIENKGLREKNDKLQKKIQGLKIGNDDLKKSMKQIQKDYDKLKTEYKDSSQLSNRIEAEKEVFEQKIISLEEEKRKLEDRVLVLEERLKSKDSNKNKICCLFKGLLKDDMFSAYDIDFYTDFTEENAIQWDAYDGIWICTKDFSFGEQRTIKRLVRQCEVIKFSNVRDLIDKLMVGE